MTELTILSLFFSNMIKYLPVWVICILGIIILTAYGLNRYLKSSYVPSKIYEDEKKLTVSIIDQYKKDIETKSCQSYEDVQEKINSINNNLMMKYVLKEEFKEKIDNIEEKMDGLNDKIDSMGESLSDKIANSEQRITSKLDNVFLSMSNTIIEIFKDKK